MKFSTVIATRNRAALLDGALTSLRAQLGAPAIEYVPAAQAVQVVETAAAKEPAGQVAQAPAPGPAALPAGQSEQAAAPAAA